MVTISDAELENIIDSSIKSLPVVFQNHIENIAFIVEDEPSNEQRQKLQLRDNQTLFGLYEGVPLPQRQGTTKIYPDKITIFKLPLFNASRDLKDLRSNVGRTVWHEIGHYYGLDHQRIAELEAQEKRKGN